MFLCCDEASIKIAGRRNYGRLYGQKSTDRKDIGIGSGIGTNSYLYRNVPVFNRILKNCYGIVPALVLVLSPCSGCEIV